MLLDVKAVLRRGSHRKCAACQIDALPAQYEFYNARGVNFARKVTVII